MENKEDKVLEDASKRLRDKDRQLQKKFGFECAINYFDADELAIQLRDAAAILKRDDGQEIVLTAIPDYVDKQSRMVLKPESVVELFFLPKEHIEAMILAGGILGITGSEVLKAPGLEEMKKYCVKLTNAITDEAIELKKQKIDRIFEKLYHMLGGEIEGKKDLLVKRIKYYRDVCHNYSEDRVSWKPEMKRLGLIK